MTDFFRLLLFVLVLLIPLHAGDEAKKPWTNSTKLSLVSTDGNSNSQTLGFANEFNYEFESANFEWKVAGVSVETTKINRRAIGSVDDFDVDEDKSNGRTAENYTVSMKYDHKISETVFWFAGLNWKKDQFAGIQSKSGLAAGLGNVVIKNEKTTLKVDYGLQANRQEDVFESPDSTKDFAAARISSKWQQRLSKSANFTQEFSGETNLEESSDIVLQMENKVAARINNYMSLDLGLKLLHDAEPAFIGLKLYEDDQSTTSIGTVPFQKEKLDTTFTSSFSINF